MERKRMAGFSVVFVALNLMMLGLGAEGARMTMMMKEEEQQSYRPQNFIAAGGFIPTTPGTPGFSTGFGFGPSGFCTFPGGCTNNLPVPGAGGSNGGVGVGSHSGP